MVYLFTGENNFELTRVLERMAADFAGAVERYDGEALELRRLPDLLMASTLFAEQRLVIIKGLSDNKALWSELPKWLERLSSDVTLALVEPKPDKRTAAYKTLVKIAEVKEFAPYAERDRLKLETWVTAEALADGMTLDKKSAHLLVERVGLDQWQLHHALEKLVLAGRADELAIRELIEPNPVENVFSLLETALAGDTKKLHAAVQSLELTQDPYQLFALLSGQAFQLLAMAAAGAGDDPVKDFGLHPYVAGKLRAQARKLGLARAKRVVAIFASADTDLKTSRGEPWVVIEKALLQSAN